MKRMMPSGDRPPPLPSPMLPFLLQHPPSPARPPPQEGEEEALAISDKRTLYLVNIFVGNTARFLNSFAALCDQKLSLLHRKILRLDASLSLLEAKLNGARYTKEFEKNGELEETGSSSHFVPQDHLLINRVPDEPQQSGESFRNEGQSN